MPILALKTAYPNVAAPHWSAHFLFLFSDISHFTLHTLMTLVFTLYLLKGCVSRLSRGRQPKTSWGTKGRTEVNRQRQDTGTQIGTGGKSSVERAEIREALKSLGGQTHTSASTPQGFHYCSSHLSARPIAGAIHTVLL